MKQVPQKAKDILSWILTGSLIFGLLMVVVGAILFLWEHGRQVYDFSVFKGVHPDLTILSQIYQGALEGSSLAIMQLGILILIATPSLRVFSCLIFFIWERSYLYAFFATFVLLILLHSIFLPLM